MAQVQMPPGFFWSGPPVELPVQAMGAMVMDARGLTVANCPNSSMADVVAWHINVAHGVHPPSYPWGSPPSP